MAETRRTALTTSYLGAEQVIPPNAIGVEWWGVDADPATAHVDVWLRLTDQAGTEVELLITAGQTYYLPIDKGSPAGWTYNVKATSGTPEVCVRIH